MPNDRNRDMTGWDIGTRAVHAGERGPKPNFTPVSTPIYRSAAYMYDEIADLDAVFAGQQEGYVYARYGNPTITALEEAIRDLEGGDVAVVTASGMAAVHLALLAAGVGAGERIVAARDLYGATFTLLMNVLSTLGIESTFVDTTDTEATRAAIMETKPRVVLIEAMSNPLLRITDVPAIAAAAHAVGARVVLDGTFTPPPVLFGFANGADFVVHSMTKYLNGHADALAGVVIGKGDEAHTLIPLVRTLGPNLAANEAYMVLRGLKTLTLRLRRQMLNAKLIARALARDPRIARVIYPGLPSHPQYETARRLFKPGWSGGMVAFELAGATQEAVMRFMDTLHLCVPATSLGDVYTLITCPAMTSHREVAPRQRERMGITPGLLRLSAGIEHPRDIIGDLMQALDAANIPLGTPIIGKNPMLA
ncbi:MAG: PLP-dependent aspartate aminotransferase family protein [Chloroflexota bacterium]|nr:PLP-dependent aspartate aminotransferase family protein [Chloroflexota bacterium]